MQLINAQEPHDFIDEHIAHRLTALLSVIRRQQADPNFFAGRSDVYRASIEGSYIMLRVFIEFLAWNQRDITENSRFFSAHETQRRATRSEHEIQT
jgi:hypothetical protein